MAAKSILCTIWLYRLVQRCFECGKGGVLSSTKQVKNEQADVTQHILDIAAIHFAEKGFAGARVDEISAEAGISKSSIYYRVGDKEALYHGVIVHMISSMLEETKEKVQKANNPREKLKIFIHTTAGFVLSCPHFSPIMMREVASGGANMSTETLTAMGKLKVYLHEILQEGAEQGVFRQVDSSLVHLVIGGTVNFFATSTSIREKLALLSDEHECQCLLVEKEAVVSEISDFVYRAVKEDK